MELTIGRTNRIARAAKFGAVGVVGLGVNLVAQFVFAEALGLNYLLAAILATQVSSTANFLMADGWVFDPSTDSSDSAARRRRFIAFLGMNNAALILRAPMMWLLTSAAGVHYSISNLISLLLMTAIRFGIADRLIWGEPQALLRAAVVDAPPAPPPAVDQQSGGPLHRARRSMSRVRIGRPTSEQLVLVAIVIVAAIFRLSNLTAVGLNSDEAVYAGQGAALFGVGDAAEHFSLFRAHPLLLQAVMGATFRVVGQDDFAARYVVAVLFGIGSVIMAYLLGKELRDRTAGFVAAGMCAVLPYHVIVSRQVLVDTAMGFFAAASLYLLIRWMRTLAPNMLIGAFVTAGLAALSKEIAVLLFPILLYGMWLARGKRVLWAPATRWCVAIYTVIVLPFPLTRLISQSKNASSFFLWQFTRAPNHGREWFIRVLVQYVTPFALVPIVIGILLACLHRRRPERVVLAYIGVFFVFFTLWPTKLFPYLFLLIPALCALAGHGVVQVEAEIRTRLRSTRTAFRAVAAVATLAVFTALSTLSWRAIEVKAAKDLPGLADFDVEVQSFAGTRDFALWARTTPENARFLTVGPSLGNILRFYGDRDSVAMSVSIDPKKRNPAYVPVPNPDASLRSLEVQYVVWDTYSADRSSFYSARTLSYARKFGGVIVFSTYMDDSGDLKVVYGPAPRDIRPLVVVYSVNGGPLPADDAADAEAGG